MEKVSYTKISLLLSEKGGQLCHRTKALSKVRRKANNVRGGSTDQRAISQLLVEKKAYSAQSVPQAEIPYIKGIKMG